MHQGRLIVSPRPDLETLDFLMRMRGAANGPEANGRPLVWLWEDGAPVVPDDASRLDDNLGYYVGFPCRDNTWTWLVLDGDTVKRMWERWKISEDVK